MPSGVRSSSFGGAAWIRSSNQCGASQLLPAQLMGCNVHVSVATACHCFTGRWLLCIGSVLTGSPVAAPLPVLLALEPCHRSLAWQPPGDGDKGLGARRPV